jgi:Domain of unknown function (DUF4389)
VAAGGRHDTDLDTDLDIDTGACMYPARLDVQTPDKIANWRPLLQWIMAIPHVIVMYFVVIVADVVAVVSWFAILFTGRLPEGLANVSCMALRYQTRVEAYAGFLHAEYPPFDFATTPGDPGGTPVAVNFEPALAGRNRLTCALRILWLIPAAIVTMIIGLIGGVCWFIGFFAVLFTGRWPAGLHAWVMRSMRASLRLSAYAMLLTDEYPPMSFD